MRVSLFLFVLTVLMFPNASTMAREADESPKERDRYELMKLFVDTFQQIEANYVKDVDQRVLIEGAINGMLSELDQYSAFIPPRSKTRFNQMMEQEFGGIGITVNTRGGRVTVVSPLPGTPAHTAGIRAGDIIVEVEGVPTKGMRLADAIQKLQGPVGRPVTLKVVHLGEKEPQEKTLVRELIKSSTIRGERYRDDATWDFMLQTEPRIGYVRMTNFSRYTFQELKEAVDELMDSKMEGLVLDLRFNPGGLLQAAIQIADLFLTDGEIVSVKGRNVKERSWNAHKQNTYPDFPIAVLVNTYSASASEVLSACLQDNKRAVIVGERTWGKGSVQNIIQMEDGDSALKLTTASYHRPSGVNIHRFKGMKVSETWGVTPDKGYDIPFTAGEWREWDDDRSRRDVLSPPGADPVEPTFEDRQLQAAVAYLEEKIAESEQPNSQPESPPTASSEDSAGDETTETSAVDEPTPTATTKTPDTTDQS